MDNHDPIDIENSAIPLINFGTGPAREPGRIPDVAGNLKLSEQSWAQAAEELGVRQRKIKKDIELASAASFCTFDNIAVWYGRNSSSDAEGGDSDVRQQRRCISIGERNGLPQISRGFFDQDTPGRIWERRALQALIKFLVLHPGCILIVEDVDRLIRVPGVLHKLAPILHEYRIRLYDAEGFVTEIKLLEKAARASAEYEKNVGRIHDGLKRAFSRGRWIGRAPFGYVFEKTSVLKPGPDATHVEFIYERREAGDSYTQICMALKAKGVKSSKGNYMGIGSVKKILTSLVYAGFTRFNTRWGEFVNETPHTRIISVDRFRAVQPDENKISPRRGFAIEHMPYAMSGTLICGYCDGPMRPSVAKNRPARMVCKQSLIDACDASQMYDYRTAERVTLAVLAEVLNQPDFENIYLADLVEAHASKRRLQQVERAEYTADLEQAQARYDTARHDAMALGMMADMKPLIEEQKELIRSLTYKLNNLKTEEFAPFLASDLPTLRDSLSMIAARSPFRPEGVQEYGLLRNLQKVIKKVVMSIGPDASVVQTVHLELGPSLDIMSHPVEFSRTVTYSHDLPRASVKNMQAMQAMIASDGYRFDPELRAQILSTTGFRERIVGKFDDETVTLLMRGLELCFLGNMPLISSIKYVGITAGSPISLAFRSLRNSQDGIELARLIKTLLPDCRQINRLSIDLRPGAYLRARMGKVEHPLLEHPLAMEGGLDRDLDDAEWAVMEEELAKALPVKSFRKRRQPIRNDFNRVLRSLRSDGPALQKSAKRAIALQHNNRAFQKMCSALLIHAGLRARTSRKEIPIFK